MIEIEKGRFKVITIDGLIAYFDTYQEALEYQRETSKNYQIDD